MNRSQRAVLALAVSSQAAISVVQWGSGALGPQLAHAYGLSAAGLGALLNATSLGNAATLVVAGVLIDHFGPRSGLIWGGLVAGGVLAVAGTASSPWVLGTGLFVSGAAGALVAVAGTVTVFHGFRDERRGLALGVRQAAVAGGGLIASVMLPGLAALGGVRLALGASGVLTAVTAFVFGLSSPRGRLAEAGHRAPVAPLTVLRTPGMPRLLVLGLVQVAVLTTVLTFSVTALRADGASAAAGSLLFAVVSISAMAARLVWGRVADTRSGTRRRETLRDTGVLACAGALAYWVAAGIGVPAQIAVMPLFAFGALGFNGVLYVLSGELAGPDRAGQALGFASMVLFGGSALAAVPLGALADAYGFRALWIAAAALAAIGVLISRDLPASRREPLAAEA